MDTVSDFPFAIKIDLGIQFPWPSCWSEILKPTSFCFRRSR